MEKSIEKEVSECFESNPDQKVIHTTSDGRMFFHPIAAGNHASSLKDRKVMPYTRQSTESAKANAAAQAEEAERLANEAAEKAAKKEEAERLSNEEAEKAAKNEEAERLANEEAEKAAKGKEAAKVEELQTKSEPASNDEVLKESLSEEYRLLTKRGAHHTWDTERIQKEINEYKTNNEK